MDLRSLWSQRHSLFLLLFLLLCQVVADTDVDDLFPLWIVLGVIALLAITIGILVFLFLYRKKIIHETKDNRSRNVSNRNVIQLDDYVISPVNSKTSNVDVTTQSGSRPAMPKYVLSEVITTTKHPHAKAATTRYHTGGVVSKHRLNDTMSTEYGHAAAHDTLHYYPLHIKTSEPQVTTGEQMIWDGIKARRISSRPSRYFDPVVSPDSGSHVFDYGAFHRPLVTGNDRIRRSNSFTYGTAPGDVFSSHGTRLRSYPSGYVRTRHPYSTRYTVVPLAAAHRYGTIPHYSDSQALHSHRRRHHSGGDYLDSSQLLDTTTIYSNGEPVKVFSEVSPRISRRQIRHDENDNVPSDSHRSRHHNGGDYLDSSQLLDTTTIYRNGEPVKVFSEVSPRISRRQIRHDDNDNVPSDNTLYESNTYSLPM